jgi:glycosyltransferase involved in cell wall biosynthesis
MNFSKDLIITIPTFNRETLLEIWLQEHAELMFLKGIRIHIQDNCSTDKTSVLLKKWKNKYKNISFEINRKNIYEKNFEKAINNCDSKFVWLVGDTYQINEQLLDKVISKIKIHSPLFFIINLKEKIKSLEDSYVDANFVCEKLSGILSCVSCGIYNKNLLGKIKFEEHKVRIHFSHTVYILNRLKFFKAKAYWVSSSIYMLPNMEKLKKNWADNAERVFEVGCKNWILSINSLIGYSSTSRQKAFRLFSEITNLFNWKGGLWLRSKNILTFKKINSYSNYLEKSNGKRYLYLYIISIIPVFILRILRKFYDKCLKK